ncbi:MAG: glycosyltransferase family 4 protein [Clostridia bacterium]|nr:glycosyltransferase family 4 protein [Clostridia bacterium]
MKACILTSVHLRTDSRVFEKEATSLRKNGYEVTLICADGRPDEIKNGVNIISVKKENNRIKRMLLSTDRVYKKALEINADIYHIEDSELVNIGLKLVKHGYKVVYDIHEDVVGSVYEKDWIPKLLKGLFSKLLERNEIKAARKLSGVITATPYLAEKYRLWGGKNVVDICNYPIIENLSEPSLYADRTIDAAYTGICLTKNRGAIQMAEACKNARVHFNVYGELRPTTLKEEMLEVCPQDSISFHGIVPFSELQKTMSNVKIGFLIEHPTTNAMNALCIKMFEYMSHGIAIICSDIPLWKEIIDIHNCGICVNPYDVNAITDAIKFLTENPEQAEKMGVNGYNAVMNIYSWEKEIEKLLNMYSSILE